MQRHTAIGFATWILWGLCAWVPAHAGELDTLKGQLKKGQAKAALKQLDKYMKQAVALRVDALAQLGQVEKALRAYEVLVAMNDSEDPEVLGKLVWSYTRDLLGGSDGKGQQVTAEFLGKMKKKEAVKALLPLLSSPNFLTRMKAAEALGELGDKSAVKPLRKLLEERRPFVRYQAALALAQLRDKGGMEALQTCYQKETGGSKLMCARFLGEVKDRGVAEFLREQMASNNNRRVRAQLAQSLKQLGDKSWIKLFTADLSSDTASSRKIAATTLGDLGGKSARDKLVGLLKDGSKEVQIAAGYALGRLGRREGGSVLAGLLKDSNPNTRVDAAQALVEVKDPETQEALEAALRDPHLLVRLYAAEALLALGFQTGGGVIRDAFVRGNPEIKAIAARIGMKFSAARKLKGRPLSPTTGELPPPTILRVDAGSGEPEEEPAATTKTEPAARTQPGARVQPDARTTSRRRPPPRRRGDEPEEDW
ncbi:HEAT repeat domain-containing protein [Myxococcota bacterium]|nr:HEAT repeat domain-containing protein [Myxococcota bacterium]